MYTLFLLINNFLFFVKIKKQEFEIFKLLENLLLFSTSYFNKKTSDYKVFYFFNIAIL